MSTEAELFSVWKDDVIQVKKLYNERRYKPCTALCQERLKSAVHPLQKSFLRFYSAVCYESLGALAHEYSSNKILFLSQAQEAFEAAQAALPIIVEADVELTASARTEVSQYRDQTTVFLNIPVQTPCPEADSDASPSTVLSRPSSVLSYGLPRTITIDFDDYSTRGSFFRPSSRQDTEDHGTLDDNDSDDDSSDSAPPSPTPIGRQKIPGSQLSASLSSKHVLAKDLIPSPLFSRKLGMTRTASGQIPHLPSIQFTPSPLSTNYETPSIPPRPQSTPPRTNSRPLPPLPFNHKPKFTKMGNRHVLIPSFSKAPHPPHSAPIQPPRPYSPVTTTPMTPRIQKLARIFSPDPSNPALDAYLTTKTPHHLQVHGSTSSSTPLNCTSTPIFDAQMRDFHKQITYHINHTASLIEHASRIQSERATRKLDRGVHRLASFWTFETRTAIGGGQGRLNGGSGRLSGVDGGFGNGEDEKKERKRELREKGWKVDKEAYGWKGEEYYERVRERAEMELLERMGG